MIRSYPKISIITPSYNQGSYLEQTILSVISQGYPNLEYIVMDGGSQDNSLEIIKKYEEKIDYWVSEKDKGQADAIFRGFEIATGDIIAWVNSDDSYMPNALNSIGKFFANNPLAKWCIGDGIFIDANDNELLRVICPPITFDWLLNIGTCFVQPSAFIDRNAFFECGGFDRNLKFCFDYDLFLSLSQKWKPFRINEFLSKFRLHEMSKSNTLAAVRRNEDVILYEKYRKELNFKTKVRKFYYLAYLSGYRTFTSGLKPFVIWRIFDSHKFLK